ncbi:hypothetical protein BGX38DRAFT_1294822 [Terfezia claveryi]|nr:hypothetical protein BGX38DRAFT_1294822 [Terfezia claveryi]
MVTALMALTRGKKKTLVVTPEVLIDFDNIKLAQTSPAVLQRYKYVWDTIVYTNASVGSAEYPGGLGVVIVQKDEEGRAHNPFTPAEKPHPEPQGHSNSNFDAIISPIIEFLSTQLYYDLVIPDISVQTATKVVQYFNCVTKALEAYPGLPAKLLERFRYTYDSTKATLAIWGMPTKPYDILAEFFSSTDFTIQLLQNPGAFTSTKRLHIKPWLSNVALPGSSKRTCDGSNKLGRREKLGDYHHPRDVDHHWDVDYPAIYAFSRISSSIYNEIDPDSGIVFEIYSTLQNKVSQVQGTLQLK